MNISYNWLKDLIDIDLTAEELAAQLTRVGITVEGVHPHGDDSVLDIDLTSNRPDCLSHLGVAREIAAITGHSLRDGGEQVSDEIPLPAVLAYDVVAIQDPELCNRFTARIIKNVKIGPSPEWLVKRLEAIGERSINNVADITNYVMHELGQPMHAFDLDKLSGRRIIVRRARAGETIRTLDEVERQLDDSMLVIADAETPAAIAGIMGGLDSSITETTTNVLLEVAYFDRANIRRTSRKLNLATEASYRFERGVDIDNLKRSSDRASNLIRELAGGEPGEFVDVYPSTRPPRYVESRDISTAVKRLTGLDIPTEESVRILGLLGITSPDGQIGTYEVPSWRHDISIEEDLVEEVARHAGYENIREELPPAFGAGEYQAAEPRKKDLRRTLESVGFNEAVSYSFIDTASDDRFSVIPDFVDANVDEPYVTLRDSVIEGAVRMRPTLLPGLLDAVRTNFNHQRKDLRMFEIGKAFATTGGEDGLPTERELFALVMTGGFTHADRAMAQRDVDFYDARGAIEAALEAVGVCNLVFSPSDDLVHLRKGQAASISSNGRNIGSVGRLEERLASEYKFKQPVFVAELDLATILCEPTAPILYHTVPKYPGVVRDVSFIVDRSIGFEDIRSSLLAQGWELCRGVSFVDVYEGKGIEPNERSITIRLEYRSDDRTLTEVEVDDVNAQLIESVEKDLKVRRRF